MRGTRWLPLLFVGLGTLMIGSPVQGATLSTSAASTPPTSLALLPPVDLTPPTVNGTPQLGQTLSTTTGTWLGSPASFAYQWEACDASGSSCSNISGATQSTYTPTSGDVGHTLRSVVTATNSAGSASASSSPTSVITGPAPTNTTPPALSGQAVQGQTLTTTNGSWTGNPTSYTYQWQDCDAQGASCSNVSGATASSYGLGSADVGHTVRAVVTATNAGGSAAQASAPSGVVTGSGGSGSATQVGAPTPAGVTCTQTLNAGADVGSALSSASPGSTVCLNAGNWSAITLNGISPAAPGVTLAATPGQTVVVPGFAVTGANTQNLTIEGFNITVPGNTANAAGGNPSVGIQLQCGISGGVKLEYNTIENQVNGVGIYTYANSCGPHGYTQSGVTIEYNQIDHVGTGMEIDGGMSEESNFVVSHNVIGPYIQDGGDGHYVQVQGISGLTMNNNAFEGPADPAYENCNPNGSASHLNVLHVDMGQSNVTFDNNIIWHSQTCGDTVLIQDSPMDNIQIENNLDVEDPGCLSMQPYSCDANPYVVQAPHGFVFEHNTVANAERGITLGGTSGTTYPTGQSMTNEYNIATPVVQYDQDYNLWKCALACTTGNNVSSDTSANDVLGGTGNVVSWTPSWTTTSWSPVSGPGYQPPPAGYYQPTGLSLSGAGYQGQVGP